PRKSIPPSGSSRSATSSSQCAAGASPGTSSIVSEPRASPTWMRSYHAPSGVGPQRAPGRSWPRISTITIPSSHPAGRFEGDGERTLPAHFRGPPMLKSVVPKGSLEEQTLLLLERADLRVRRGSSRDYHGRIEDDRIDRVSLLRPQEIPRLVEDGFFDLGITGRDWVVETGAEVEVLARLGYAKSGAGA